MRTFSAEPLHSGTLRRLEKVIDQRPARDREGCRLCAKSDNSLLCNLTHNLPLCAKSDIVILSDLTHTEVGETHDRLSKDTTADRQSGTPRPQKRDLSQTQLGDRAGVRQETISLIETGNPAARLETILVVLAALDLEFRIVTRGKASPADIEDVF